MQKEDLFLNKFESVLFGWILALLAEISLFLIRKYFSIYIKNK